MAWTRNGWVVAGIVGLALAGGTVSPASAGTVQGTVQPTGTAGERAGGCSEPAAAWSGIPWLVAPAGVADPGVGFRLSEDSDDLVPEHQAQRCASDPADPAPGLDDGFGSLLWRGPDWGVPSLGTFV